MHELTCPFFFINLIDSFIKTMLLLHISVVFSVATQLHYLRLPKDISEDHVILMDCTVSTGAAAMMAIRVLLVSVHLNLFSRTTH